MVDTVTVDVTIDHAQAAGLTVSLTSPQNTVVSLSYGGGVWQIDPSAFQNENLDGTWTLSVTDTNRDTITGTLQSWSMTVTPLAAAASPQSPPRRTRPCWHGWSPIRRTTMAPTH